MFKLKTSYDEGHRIRLRRHKYINIRFLITGTRDSEYRGLNIYTMDIFIVVLQPFILQGATTASKPIYINMKKIYIIKLESLHKMTKYYRVKRKEKKFNGNCENKIIHSVICSWKYEDECKFVGALPRPVNMKVQKHV